MYRRMSMESATSFRRSNSGYNTYLCNISKANLVRSASDDRNEPCRECTYLVNEEKGTITLSEMCSGKYDVIFVSSDVEE